MSSTPKKDEHEALHGLDEHHVEVDLPEDDEAGGLDEDYLIAVRELARIDKLKRRGGR